MSCIRLKCCEGQKKLAVGSSKMLGNPDVWEGFDWPAIEEDGELYDINFLIQINCEEVAMYDHEGRLPKHGILYFFYDLDEMPWSPDNKDAARVLYYDGDISKLQEMVVVDEDGESLAFEEQKIIFEEVEEGFLDENEPTHLLLGKPSLDYGVMYDCIDGWCMLLQIDSFETDDADINFTDEGVLCFFIEEEKLRKLDFSDVRIMQIYS